MNKKIPCLIKTLFSFILLCSLCAQANPSSNLWWNVYFSSPATHARAKRLLPEHALLGMIRNTQKSIDGAFYEISSKPVTAELIKAHKRGIAIRLVTEKDNFNKQQVAQLLKEGIPVVPDNKRGLMHHKFAIFDSTILWTGSYNITDNGSRKNNNNAIAIRSAEICEIFSAEFIEMFNHRIFGNRQEKGPFADIIKKYHVSIDSSDINVFFSPDDNVERIILKRLKKAKKSIHFMAFSFTSDAIGEIVIQKFKQGLSVKGIFEKRGSRSRHSEFTKMKLEGIPVRTDKNRFAMHHKVIIIDEETVITGSYNFSKSANKHNDENVIIVQNKQIARAYLQEFNRLYN